ncbi:amine sulfotransferase-like [Leucoraja erinacea]|uniref:amine sulfotransferase-like n=1 Tax=Leucoraja erinaceus TaxID=7782 RepID=UPI002456A1CE|nr:amine sulfotransferase-like [Leucoraja erinacea]
MATSSNKQNLFQYKGCNFIKNIHQLEHLEKVHQFEIKETDVIAVTYPKSGTIWMQQILSLIYSDGDLSGVQSKQAIYRIPWMEVPINNFQELPSPRLCVTHLPYRLIPKDLRKGNGKVIYLTRNPKDIAVSLYHFQNYVTFLESPSKFEDFLEEFIDGDVIYSSWFDHIRDWYNHKDEFDFLFLSYEETKKDLRTTITKICDFLGRKLGEDKLDIVVEESTFKAMSNNPMANYKDLENKNPNGSFLRKGIIGDWKTHFTVAQSEKFDKIFQEKMKGFPFKFTWDSK